MTTHEQGAGPAAHAPGAQAIGRDGWAMLALSGAVLVASGGLTLLAAVAYVVAVAWRKSASVAPASSILVLGAKLAPDGRPGRRYRARLDRARVLWTATGADIVLLGGTTTPGALSEAAAGAAYLRTCGVPGIALHCEERSRDTLENLRFYRARFVVPAGAPPVLVTSRFHLARAGLLADGLGIHHHLCAAEASPLAALREPLRLLMEALLIHWLVVGRGFARLTGNARMLARIS